MATEQELRAAINQIESVETLRSIFQDVANALRRKGVEQVSIIPSEFAGLIDGIEVDSGGVDTSDGTALPSDLAKDKIAYSKNSRIVGDLDVKESDAPITAVGSASTLTLLGGDVFAYAAIPYDIIYREGARVGIRANPSLFGSATTDKVLKGETFTSSAGLKAVGTYVPPAAGTDTSNATATNADILRGKTAYAKGALLTGTIDTKGSSDLSASGSSVTVPAGYYPSQVSKSISTATKATPSISANSSGVITASYTQSAGYVTSGTVSATKNATELDSNLIASNIKSGVKILGVTGTVTEGTDTSSATATASDIASGKTAYGANGKITGSVTEVLSGTSYSLSSATPSITGSYLYLDKTMTVDRLLRTGATARAYCTKSQLGDATAADVAAGKTFTSSAGLKVTGTANVGGTKVYHATVYPDSTSSSTLNLQSTISSLGLDTSKNLTIIGVYTVDGANKVTSNKQLVLGFIARTSTNSITASTASFEGYSSSIDGSISRSSSVFTLLFSNSSVYFSGLYNVYIMYDDGITA